MKLGHLFRIFFPREATPFERSEEFFNLSEDELIKEMIRRAPKMKEVMEAYLPKMELEEILPGRMRYAVKGLSDTLDFKGLRAAITGAYSEEDMIRRVASILKMGMLSTEMRVSASVEQHGLGHGLDELTGGADSVFTQMIPTKKQGEGFYYDSQITLGISKKAIETGTYQYNFDGFGNRLLPHHGFYEWFDGSYAKRFSIQEFVKEVNTNFDGGNEVMIKDRIPPHLIEHINVSSEALKQNLIAHLKERSIKPINGKTYHEFIRVA